MYYILISAQIFYNICQQGIKDTENNSRNIICSNAVAYTMVNVVNELVFVKEGPHFKVH